LHNVLRTLTERSVNLEISVRLKRNYEFPKKDGEKTPLVVFHERSGVDKTRKGKEYFLALLATLRLIVPPT